MAGVGGSSRIVTLLLHVVILFLVGGHSLCAASITLGRREQQSVSKRPIINAAFHGDLALGIRLGPMN